jgi:hypothetical protein
MTPPKAVALISELGHIFDQSWIDEQISRAESKRQKEPKRGPKGLREHIVATWVRELRVVAKSTPQSSSFLREDALAPVVAFLNLVKLFPDRPEWIEHIVGRIKSDDTAYYKHLTEMRVAAAFREARYSVVPHLPTGQGKSPDLEVARDGLCVDVECKAQDHGSKRDSANFDNLSIVIRRALQWINPLGRPSLRLALTATRDLSAEDCSPIVEAFKNVQLAGETGPVPVGDLGTIMMVPMEPSYRIELATSQSVPVGDSRVLQEFVMLACKDIFSMSGYTYWYSQSRFRCEKKPDGRAFAEIDQAQVFGARFTELLDRTRSIVSHVRAAAEQVSGHRAALLYSEWRPPNPLSERDDYDEAIDLLKEHLPAFHTISAAVVFRAESGPTAGRFDILRNPRADFPLPDGFEPPRPR